MTARRCRGLESGGIGVVLNPSVPFHRNGKWYAHSTEMQTGTDSLTLTLTLILTLNPKP